MVKSTAALPAAPAGAQQRNYPEFTYDRVRVEMRDGVKLSVDLWRPVTPKGVDVPIILSMTPYHSLYYALDPQETNLPSGDAALFVPKGYAYARADVRGTWASGGCWDYGGIKERHDGYDLVDPGFTSITQWRVDDAAVGGAVVAGAEAEAGGAFGQVVPAVAPGPFDDIAVGIR